MLWRRLSILPEIKKKSDSIRKHFNFIIVESSFTYVFAKKKARTPCLPFDPNTLLSATEFLMLLRLQLSQILRT